MRIQVTISEVSDTSIWSLNIARHTGLTRIWLTNMLCWLHPMYYLRSYLVAGCQQHLRSISIPQDIIGGMGCHQHSRYISIPSLARSALNQVPSFSYRYLLDCYMYLLTKPQKCGIINIPRDWRKKRPYGSKEGPLLLSQSDEFIQGNVVTTKTCTTWEPWNLNTWV